MTIKVPYVKMNGQGNDFVLIDTADLPSPQTGLSQAQSMCLSVPERGIGCDQVLELTEQQDGAYLYRIWNSSGSEAGQCGNGARCAYAYLERNGRLKDGKAVLRTNQVAIEVIAGETGPHALLSKPSFNPEVIPFKDREQQRYHIKVGEKEIEFAALGLGNPHACIWDHDAKGCSLEDLVIAFIDDGRFYEGVNISLMKKHTDDRAIDLHVHERGAGKTKACGSAAAAAACVFFQDHGCEAITVKMPGGELKAGWDGKGSAWIEGAIEFEHKGYFTLPPGEVDPAVHRLDYERES